MPKWKLPIVKDDDGNRFPLVFIEWVDSFASPRWVQDGKEAEPDLFYAQTVGWLVGDGKHAKRVAQTVTHAREPFQRHGMMTIPVGAIRRIRRIR